MNKSHDEENSFDVAVVGISCRLPKAKNIQEFWENIRIGKECISFFSERELLERGEDPEKMKDPNYVPAGAILEDVDKFDASFFGYSPREVQIMDPQHRIFLEVCWNAWEDAGYNSENYDGVVSVFGSTTMNTYILHNLMSNPSLLGSLGNLQTMVGNDKDFLTTRVSYELDLKGPSYAIQTACSSSLVSVHVACNSLLNGECDMALAGGSSVRLPHGKGYLYQEGGTSSPDGHCNAFDASAKGSVVGNGAGVVVLKRMSDAVVDNDNIYGVIKATATSNDGGGKAAFATPGEDGQSRAIISALTLADVDPETVGYVEAHGTGTMVGDPIEFSALKTAFESFTSKKQYVSLGSLKPNIGHLDAAAGVCGLIKVILATKHKEIPPLVNFQEPNPNIDLENSPFRIDTSLKPWKPASGVCRAGVTGVGLGGANVHAIVEEAPDAPFPLDDRKEQLIVLSAKTATALKKIAENLSQHLKQNPNVNLSDLAYTLQMGRKKFLNRASFITSSIEECIESLSKIISDGGERRNCVERSESIAFLFPGQGSQHLDMINEIYFKEPFFRKIVDQCFLITKEHMSLDLEDLLLPKYSLSDVQLKEKEETLKHTSVAQVGLFIAEYALACQLIEWGILPRLMIGHSVGEYVAACLSGVFTLEAALKIVIQRGKLMGKLEEGKMLSALMSIDEAQKFIKEGVDIACENAPDQVVFSGKKEEMELLKENLENLGVVCKSLRVSHAFHSNMMESILKDFEECFSGIDFGKPNLEFVSNVSGDVADPELVRRAKYWVDHLRKTVKYSCGVKTLVKCGVSVYLEVGPGDVLTKITEINLAREKEKSKSGLEILNTCPASSSKDSVHTSLINSIGWLWKIGVRPLWGKFHHSKRGRIPLPTYPFEKKSFWIEEKTVSKKEQQSTKFAKNKEDSFSRHSYTIQASEVVNAFSQIFSSLGNPNIQIQCGQAQETQIVQHPVTASVQKVVKSGVKEKVDGILFELLGVQQLSMEDDLKDHGAHSLMLTQLLSRIRAEFSIEMTMQELFEATVIQDLYRLVESQVSGEAMESFKVSKESKEEIDEILDRLENLTTEEVEELFNE